MEKAHLLSLLAAPLTELISSLNADAQGAIPGLLLQCPLELHLSLACGPQVADFREQLLSCAGVDPARIMEFSCGKCAGGKGRGYSLCWTMPSVQFCQHSKQHGIYSRNYGNRPQGCLFSPTELLLAGSSR